MPGGRAARGAGRRRLGVSAGVAVAVVVAVGVVGLASPGRSAGRSAHPVALPSGLVLATTSAGAAVLAATDGSVRTTLPPTPGTGFLAASDGRYLATGNGQQYVLQSRTLVPTADIPLIGPPGSWRAVDFTDDDRGLVATEESLVAESVGVEVETFVGHRVVTLGSAESVAGDPAALGVFAVATSSFPHPHPGGATTVVERRDAGADPVVLADATELLSDLHDSGVTAVALTVVPDPKGDRIAVVVVPAAGRPAAGGIVVLGRDGRLLGAVTAPSGGVGRPAWSPDGRSLVYDVSSSRRAEVAVWAVGSAPVVASTPSARGAQAGGGTCIWSVTGDGYLCAASKGVRATWLVGRPGSRVLATVSGPALPVAWLAASGTAPLSRRAGT